LASDRSIGQRWSEWTYRDRTHYALLTPTAPPRLGDVSRL